MRNRFYWVKYYVSSYIWSWDTWRRIGHNVLASWGAILLLIRIVSFFSKSEVPEPPALEPPTIEGWLAMYGIWFFIFASLATFFYSLPKTVIRHRLRGRDVTIEIRIADAFEVKGDLVVPISTTFDTNFSGETPKPPSILGKFIREHYPDVKTLDHLIDEELKNEKHKELHKNKYKKNKQYPIGTVVQIKGAERSFYLVANSHINKSGGVDTDIQLIRESLVKLWDDISTKGGKGKIVVPLIGTGKGMLVEKREQIAMEIILSFIASCSSVNYCDKLIIAIYPSDATDHNIDLKDLQDSLECSCRYPSTLEENRSDKVDDVVKQGEGIE